MAAMKLFSAIASRFQAGPFVSEEPNLPSGGHSGYHPDEVRVRRSSARRNAPAAPMGYQSTAPAAQYGQPGYTGYTASQPMQPMGQMTGYQPAPQTTGSGVAVPRVPYLAAAARGGNAGAYQPTAQQTGYPAFSQTQPLNPSMMQQPVRQGYGGGYPPVTGMNAGGYGQMPGAQAMPVTTGSWAVPVQQPAAPVMPQQQAVPGGYRQNWPQGENKPYENKFGQSADQPEADRNRRFGREDAAQPAAQPLPDNVSYMPNVFVGNDGAAYRHVERLTQPMSAATCYRLIEFMRNGETVIVNTELIQDERENQRCLDLLYGAAYTMKCTFTRISAKSIYLIAPATVSVISYESIRQMNEQDVAVRWPGSESAFFGGSRPRHQPVFGNARAAE